MNEPRGDSQPPTSQSLLARVDKICDAFESALASNPHARTEQFLEDWPKDERRVLLEHLLELELDYRHRVHKTVDRADYFARFGDVEDILHRLFARLADPKDQISRLAADTASVASSSTDVLDALLPGALINNRYRIAGKLGAGGMGEVYRADDLRLGQPVAIKVLPERLAHDPARLKQFLNEARLARRIAHPHVCRVYDVDEYGGRTLLSMQLIDGEDLKRLLRRIGPLPVGKIVQLAHQLCSGLAAAHDNAVIHRDLKPANVMIDGRGHARITDFGLARLSEDGAQATGAIGTPAYMAPEQYFHYETSVQSDIYALGLVLYEMLTGCRAHPASTREALAAMLCEPPPEFGVSSSVGDPDYDALCDVIHWCLQPDPQMRPASALTVAASLPGGDPLAAALAAGDTPSARTLAATRDANLPSPAVAWSLFAAFLVALLCSIGLWGQLADKLGFDEAPQALAAKARETLDDVGVVSDGMSEAWGLAFDANYARYLANQGVAWDSVEHHDPPILYFWHRTSPTELAPKTPHWSGESFLDVDEQRPAFDEPGMVTLRTDMAGRLTRLERLVERGRVSPGDAADGAFVADKARNLVLSSNGETRELPGSTEEPLLNPRGFADQRVAWSVVGLFKDWPDISGRVEVATSGDSLVQVMRLGPWTQAESPADPARLAGRSGLRTIIVAAWLPLLLAGGGFMARRNLRRERCDLRGAKRLALAAFATSMVVWLLRDAHTASASELDLLFTALAASLLLACIVWCSYIALEPDARRIWPRTMIGWSRIVLGKFRDARVGAEVLVGATAGAVVGVLKLTNSLAPLWLGQPTDSFLQIVNLNPLRGVRIALGETLAAAGLAVLYTFFTQLLFLLLLRLVLRTNARAVAAYALFMALLVASQHSQFALTFALTAIEMTITACLFMKVGLLAVVVMHTVRLLIKWPLALSPGFWGFDTALLSVVFITALATWGLFLLLGSREKQPPDLRIGNPDSIGWRRRT